MSLSTSRKDILPIYLSILPPRTQSFFRSFSSDRVLRLVQSLRFAELHATDPKANKGRGGRAKTRIRDHSYVLSKQELVADRPLRSQSWGLYEQRQLQQPPVATRSRAALVRRLPEQRWISYRWVSSRWTRFFFFFHPSRWQKPLTLRAQTSGEGKKKKRVTRPKFDRVLASLETEKALEPDTIFYLFVDNSNDSWVYIYM